MAGVTLHRLVAVDQAIVRQIVVESFGIELHDVRGAALVLRMTRPAIKI